MYSVSRNALDYAEWDLIVDVRSPGEYAEDHMPGALSFPVLDNEERCEVGTLHTRESPFLARLRGAALIAQNLHDILASHVFQTLDQNANILVYCWRGGERSKSLAHVLAKVGWNVGVLSGGYKAYRAHVRDHLESLGRFEYHVIGGSTGSAKGKLLDMIQAEGGQVVDLEGLANHKGSILGANPESPQPSQKAFESSLVHVMAPMDEKRVVFVESESNLVGKLHVPKAMFANMQRAPRSLVALPIGQRVAWIRSCYKHFETTHVEELRLALRGLVKLRGHAQVDEWMRFADEGKWDELVESLLVVHYDPAYSRSAEVFYSEAQPHAGDDHQQENSVAVLEMTDTSDDTYRQAARKLLAAVPRA